MGRNGQNNAHSGAGQSNYMSEDEFAQFLRMQQQNWEGVDPELQYLTDDELAKIKSLESEENDFYKPGDYLFPYEKVMENGKVVTDGHGNPVFQRKESMKHIDEPLLTSGSAEELEKYLNEKKAQLTQQEIAYLNARIDVLKVTDTIEREGKKALFHGDTPGKPIATVDKDGFLCLEDIQGERQTSRNGCWSVSLSLMLRSRGIWLTQEQIRAYRPGFGGDSKVNADAETSRDFNVDEYSSPYEHADLVLKVLPNTSMATLRLNPVNVEGLTLNGKALTDNERKSALEQLRATYAKTVADTIREAIQKHSSPLSMSLDGHFVTVTGISEDGKTIRYEDSLRKQADAEYVSTRTITMDQLLNDYVFDKLSVDPQTKKPRVEKMGVGLSLSWLQEIEPPEYDKRKEQPGVPLPDVPEAAKPDENGIVKFSKPDGKDDVVIHEKEAGHGRIAGQTVGVNKKLDQSTLTGPLQGKQLQLFDGAFSLGSVETYLPKQIYYAHDPKLLYTTGAAEIAKTLHPELNDAVQKLPADAPQELRQGMNTFLAAIETLSRAEATAEELNQARQQLKPMKEFLNTQDEKTGKSYHELLDADEAIWEKTVKLLVQLGLESPIPEIGLEPEDEPEDRELTEDEKILALGLSTETESLANRLDGIENASPQLRQLARDAAEGVTNVSGTAVGFRQGVIKLNAFLARKAGGKTLGEIAVEREWVKPDYLQQLERANEALGIKKEELPGLIADIHEQQPIAEAPARPPEAPLPYSQNAKQYIELLQAEMGKLPRKDPTPEDRLRQQKIVMRIFAARMDVDAERGSWRGKSLDKTRRETYEEKIALPAMEKDPTMRKWLERTSYEELRSLIATGHGGKMESAYKSYLCSVRTGALPDKMLDRFMITAKERCEGLQATLKLLSSATPTEKVPAEGIENMKKTFCMSLFAARKAAEVQRGGEGLNTIVEPKKEKDYLNSFKNTYVEMAVNEIVTKPENRALFDLALKGHGGRFVDAVDALAAKLEAKAMKDRGAYDVEDENLRLSVPDPDVPGLVP